MYRYKLEPAQEFIGTLLFGIFVLPWLFIGSMIATAFIIQKIRDAKDKKDPSRKLKRLKETLISTGYNGWLRQIFLKDSGSELIDFDNADRSKHLSRKDNIVDYKDLILKLGKWSLCVSDLAKISDMNDAGNQIQKTFAKYFKNNELFTGSYNGVKFTGISVKEDKTLDYPNNDWFKKGAIKSFVVFSHKQYDLIASSLDNLISTTKTCLDAPNTHKDDKKYLLGCLNFIKTVDKVVSMTESLTTAVTLAAHRVENIYNRLNEDK